LTNKRFTCSKVEALVVALQLPDTIHADNHIVEDSRTALCMLLGQLGYLDRLSDLTLKFGWPVERVSCISSMVQEIIHSRWKHLLIWDAIWLTPEKLVQYAHTIKIKGAPIGIVWGFIDGTIRAIACQTRWQRTYYNR
ncbi:hypothetical protein L873DRAFT_1855933, partial [Choiromyces venosus 120613-1]